MIRTRGAGDEHRTNSGVCDRLSDNELLEGRIADELARLSDVGQIRIIDAVFVMRDGEDVSLLSVSDLDDDQRAELRSAVGALVGLGVAGVDGAIAGAELGAAVDADAPVAAEAVAAGLLEDLPDGSSALVLAIEHLWAIPLRDAVRDAGGVVIGHRSLTAEDLIAFGMNLGAEAAGSRRSSTPPTAPSELLVWLFEGAIDVVAEGQRKLDGARHEAGEPESRSDLEEDLDDLLRGHAGREGIADPSLVGARGTAGRQQGPQSGHRSRSVVQRGALVRRRSVSRSRNHTVGEQSQRVAQRLRPRAA